MIFSPEQVDSILERTAHILADKIVMEIGDMAEMAVFDLRTAAKILSLSTKQVPVYLPITRTADGKHGVTVGAIRRHILSRTDAPTGKRRGREA